MLKNLTCWLYILTIWQTHQCLSWNRVLPCNQLAAAQRMNECTLDQLYVRNQPNMRNRHYVLCTAIMDAICLQANKFYTQIHRSWPRQLVHSSSCTESLALLWRREPVSHHSCPGNKGCLLEL